MIFSRECNKGRCEECFENSEDCDCKCHKTSLIDDDIDDDIDNDNDFENNELINGKFL